MRGRCLILEADKAESHQRRLRELERTDASMESSAQPAKLRTRVVDITAMIGAVKYGTPGANALLCVKICALGLLPTLTAEGSSDMFALLMQLQPDCDPF